MSQDVAVPEIRPAISFANKTFREHFLLLLGAFYIAGTICQSLTLFLDEHLRSLVVIIYGSFFAGGLINIFLGFCDGGNPKFSILFSKTKLFWKFLCAHLLALLACGLGFLLLVIPGVILMIRLSLYAPAIAERELGPLAALKYSWQITSGRFWKLVLFNLAAVGILFIPAIITGILVSIVTTTIASIMHMRATSLSEFFTGLAMPVLFIWWQLMAIHCYRQLSPPYKSEATVATTQS
ncbi:MAG: hypothetical protein C5B53_12900 [Candidatus Melainabacteria bacterium]|nr:MAG: hypothetical protein C5B53_12900 [Candidatus Melainabacteria bacterium]